MRQILFWIKRKNQIQELCNNMNFFLTCPKNLLNNEKENNKELKFLEIIDDYKNDIGNQRNIKKYLFHYLIMIG